MNPDQSIEKICDIIIINKSKTGLEGKADVVVQDSIGAVPSGVTELMGIGK